MFGDRVREHFHSGILSIIVQFSNVIQTTFDKSLIGTESNFCESGII